MKRLLMALAIVLMPVSVAAQTTHQKERFVYIPKDQVIEGNLYRAGDAVEVHGSVNGDVIVAGGVVKITGPVAGDVIAVGGRVHVSGPVQGDLRVAGGEILVDSVVGKNATIAGGNVTFGEQSAVGWEAMVFSGMLDMQGDVQKDIRGAVGAAILDGVVGRDVWLKIGEPDQLVLQPNANIKGNLTYLSPTPATIMSGATINGEVKFHAFSQPAPNRAKAAVFAFIAFKLILMLSLWIVGLVYIWMLPKAIEQMNRVLDKRPARAFGHGLLVLLVAPLAIVLLAVSVVGIPLAIVLAAGYVLYLFTGYLTAATYLGERVLRTLAKRPWHISLNWAMVLGVAILVAVSCIPFIGGLIKFIALAFGIGAITVLKIEGSKKWR